MPGMLHTRMGGGKREEIIFSNSFGFSSQSVVELQQCEGHDPSCLNLKLPGCDADPRHAFFLTALLLIHTSSKNVLPLIRFNCPAICYVVRLDLKYIN